MKVIGFIEKCIGADAVQEGPCPGGATMHTVGILDGGTHIGFDALDTGLLVALTALGFFAHNGRIGFRTDRTTGDLDH